VQILLDTDRRTEAEAFVAEQGLEADAVDAAIAARRELDLYNAGVDAYNGGDYEEAIAAFRAVADGGDDGDPRRVTAAKNLVSALLLQGGDQRDAGSSSSAAPAYKEAAERAWSIGKPEDAARALMALSEMRTEAGAVDDAATFAARAAEAAVSSGDNVLQGRAWMTMGDAYYESEPTESAASYKRALRAWGDSEDTASDAATVSYNLAVLLAAEDTPEALRLLERSATLAAAAGDRSLAQQAKDAIAQLTAE
jgi:tetratricopeptide (TPR) repeat protein